MWKSRRMRHLPRVVQVRKVEKCQKWAVYMGLRHLDEVAHIEWRGVNATLRHLRHPLIGVAGGGGATRRGRGRPNVVAGMADLTPAKNAPVCPFFLGDPKQAARAKSSPLRIGSTTLALFAAVLWVPEIPRQKAFFEPVLPQQGGNKREQTPIECVFIYCIDWLGLISCRILDPEYAPKRAPEPRVE